jgi:hypothetical protein
MRRICSNHRGIPYCKVRANGSEANSNPQTIFTRRYLREEAFDVRISGLA